eukprot:m.100678 g.100678  ORF g.100678 m.100678 type:complete len:195 (-) comp20695_c0_seq1:205-789(-)
MDGQPDIFSIEVLEAMVAHDAPFPPSPVPFEGGGAVDRIHHDNLLGQFLGPVGFDPENEKHSENPVGGGLLETAEEIEDSFVVRRKQRHQHFLTSVRARVSSQHILDSPTSPRSIRQSPLAAGSLRASSFNPNGDGWRCGRGGADTMMDSAIAFEEDVLLTPKRKARCIEDGSGMDKSPKTPRNRGHFNVHDTP